MNSLRWLDISVIAVYMIAMLMVGRWFARRQRGIGAAFHLAAENHKFSPGSFDLNLANKGNFWVMTLYGFFWYRRKYTADQTLVQRYPIAKSAGDALKGVALGALLCVPAWALFMLIGSLVWAYYQLSHEALPAFVNKPDKIFPYFLATKIPSGLWFDDEGPAVARMLNDYIAGLVRTHPKRLFGLCVLPLQDVRASLAELDRCVQSLGMKGVLLYTNLKGRFPDKPEFRPVFARAVELDVPCCSIPPSP